jgi:tetratricopeptide (TPR) repeat protein
MTLIYAQTIRVPAIDYEDSYYLVRNPYVNVTAAFSRFGAAWSEPYFANFHPVTTTTWFLDRALADKSKPFDALPFRIAHLVYAVIGASLLILLYRRLGLSLILAVLGALVYAVHPIHTEVDAWLSARKDLISLIFMEVSFLGWLWARAATTPNQWRIRHALTILLVLLAVLSKPIAVILPVLFVAYEFCSAPHAKITRWRWARRKEHPLLTRTLALTGLFLVVTGVSTVVFRSLLRADEMHGGWLVWVPIGLMPLMLVLAPPAAELESVANGSSAGVRVLGQPFVVLSVVIAAGSAWTFWAQGQAGAIKGGLTLLPTLNLTFDAMLGYAWKALVPAYMRTLYTWNAYPYVSVKGLLGAAVVAALVWMGLRLSGAQDRNRRLLAFGILWYLIAFIPVANLVPTSTKMADRYLFVPSTGAILCILSLAASWSSASHRRQLAAVGALVLVAALYAIGSYERTKVWCGKTTLWRGRPHPDLSLWTSAVETDPEDLSAPLNLALAYLRLDPPEAGQALVLLNRALQLSEASQANIAGGKQLDLSSVYAALGDAHLMQATGLAASRPGTEVWQQQREEYVGAVKFFEMAAQIPSGFAPADARLLVRLAGACEGEALMDTEELVGAAPERRSALTLERGELRRKSEEFMRRAREILVAGHVDPSDPEYRGAMLESGSIIFGREVGASDPERAGFYRQALSWYENASSLFPDDPRPFLYQGLCYERLTGMAQSAEEKRKEFELGESAFRKALALRTNSPEYSPAMAYHGLASLYSHMNEFPSVLEFLKEEQKSDPAYAESTHLGQEIQAVEQYLAKQGKPR